MSAAQKELGTIAVVGAGTMGKGFIQLLALAGATVTVTDISPERAADAAAEAIDQAREFERAGLMAPGSAETIRAATRPARSLRTAVVGADVVFEAVAENPDVKRRVIAEVEHAVADETLIATNTSAIPIGELAEGMRLPQRFLGAHWFNPAQWVPCVEVIPHARTEPAAVAAMTALLRRMGKEPTTVGDAAGFVANRIQFAMFREAAMVVADGVATAEQVDRIVRSSFGFRLPFFGPFEIADMAGLDVYAGAYAALERGLGERIGAPDSLREHVDAGRLGVKSGGGYLDLEPDAVRRMLAERDAAYVALARLRAERDARERGEREA